MRHVSQANNFASSAAKILFSENPLVIVGVAVFLSLIIPASVHADEFGLPESGIINQTSIGTGAPARTAGGEGETSEAALSHAVTKVEGTVNSIERTAAGDLQIEMMSGTNCISVLVADSSNWVPSLYSQVEVAGVVLSAPQEASGPARTRMCLADMQQLHLITGQMSFLVTNAAQFGQIQMAGFPRNMVVNLTGRIIAVSPNGEFLAFQDASGATFLNLGGRNQVLQAGRQVHLLGNAVVDNGKVVLRDPPVVNNDGYHTTFKKSGGIYLKAGRRSIRLAWFNWIDPDFLEVFYQGPGLREQRIPDSALYLPWTNLVTGATGWTNGVNYCCAEGRWFQVPDFSHLLLVKEGRCSNFNLAVKSRAEDVSLQFTGYIEVPCDGVYNFSTASDDGSLLYVDEHPTRIEPGDLAAIPEARSIVIDQTLRPDEPPQWVTVEGVVTFVNETADSLTLDLGSSSRTMRVEVADRSGICPSLLAHARIKVFGVSEPTRSTDGTGQMVVGALLTPGLNQIELLELPATCWDDIPLARISDCMAAKSPPDDQQTVHLSGRVRLDASGKSAVLDDGTGRIRLDTPPETIPKLTTSENDLVEIMGCRSLAGTNIVLQCVFHRQPPQMPADGAKVLPCLYTADQIKRLTREDAQMGYPVKLHGVVTAVTGTGFFLRDSTGGIYDRWNPGTVDYDLRAGDSLDIEGVTFAEFSPAVLVRRVTFLSRGNLPDPVRPSRDRLMNGSLDSEYVEIQGVVIGVDSNLLTLFTTGGRIRVEMIETQPQLLKHYLNAQVRIRGCVSAGRNVVTQQIDFGQIGLYNGQISLEGPAPANLFDLPLKRVSELQFFDYRAAAFHRVRIAGQILHESHGTCYLADGTDSLQFVTKTSSSNQMLKAGDLVEVVGFPEWGNYSPVLHESVVRRTGHAPLDPPIVISEATRWSNEYDGRRVSIKARLINIDTDRADQILELQVGSRRFICRLGTSHGAMPWIAPDSTLRVTGVYRAQGGGTLPGSEVNSFELLLNSPADVQVLARPSWWTLRHTLTILGAVIPIVMVAFVWIMILRRQVEKRTRELAVEIKRREQTDRQRVIEGERSRIARDLHDALGAALTQIRFLSIRGSRAPEMPEKSRAQLVRISEKSFEMVSSLDEIVWAVNPANDSLDKLVPYLCHIAEDFFSSSPIRCRLDVGENFPYAPLTSEVRHDLYLAVREVLNNTAKHSQATEVWFRIHWQNHAIRITIEDNGRGFLPPDPPNGDGLANVRHRLEKIGGCFQFETQLGSGTICRLWLPVEQEPEQPAIIPK